MGFEIKLFKKKKEKKQAEKELLTLLKVYLKETSSRIQNMMEYKAEEENEESEKIQTVDELLKKEETWFEEEKNHLISVCYYTAVLFAMMKEVRENSPFLKLTVKDDTRMLDLINNIMKDYMKYFKIHYMVQSEIGEKLYCEEEKTVLPYKEFCDLLRNEKELHKYEPLIECYLHLGQDTEKRLKTVLKDMESLNEFLNQIFPEEQRRF